MHKAAQFIQDQLQVRIENGSLRKLSETKGLIDFCSNDYLGFARSEKLAIAIEEETSKITCGLHGATGSRLISGNRPFTEATEAFIADFHQAESGLIFNSGYDANVGLVSSLAQRGDTIISDELIHASLIDGARLTYANRYTFRHNNLTDLEAKLRSAKGNIYVLAESVYSMDGDIAPLQEINMLCEQYEANLIVDEAHAIGIFGNHGKGLVQELNLEKKVFARVVTFGKAIGCHGAIVLGSNLLRDYLINFARSFIYTTAASLHNIAAIKCAYERLIELDHSLLIRKKISLYSSLMGQAALTTHPHSVSAIQTVLYSTNAAAKSAAFVLQKKGLDVRAILSPTVPQGRERLRICLHLFNKDEEISTLVDELKRLTFIS
ncbi:MAG: pyridoxal phosphate-dependent aminotransferase family protein [Pedobacter sp.]|nr:MAG: pyridoxal phosphate-dependent aminotransferase family protein [Pedobacter sp.]